MYTVIEGGVTAAKGYQAGGIACGIKKRKKDLALIYSRTPCTFAGSFTTNLVKAAPVLWDQQVVKTSETVHCILINSGNANAATGEKGLRDAEAAAALVSDRFGLQANQTLVCSTGVIGFPLPMETIEKGIDSIVKTLDVTDEAALSAAEAILTTDTFTKQVAVELLVGRKLPHWRDGERKRDDPSEHGHDALLHHHRCQDIQSGSSSASRLFDRRHLQHDQRRRGHLDQ